MFPLTLLQLLEFTVHGHMAGQDIVNVLHYVVAPVVDDPDSEDALLEFRDTWRLAWLAVASDQYVVTQYEVKDIIGLTGTTPATVRPVYGAQQLIAGAAADEGQVAGAALPTYATLTLRKLTAGGVSTDYAFGLTPDPVPMERAFRGRIGLGGLLEAMTLTDDPNLLDPTERATLDLGLSDLQELTVADGTDTATLTMVVLSTQRSNAVRVTTLGNPVLAYQAVTSLFLNQYVGSQLSRKYGGPA